jgi:hypothetical protein
MCSPVAPMSPQCVCHLTRPGMYPHAAPNTCSQPTTQAPPNMNTPTMLHKHQHPTTEPHKVAPAPTPHCPTTVPCHHPQCPTITHTLPHCMVSPTVPPHTHPQVPLYPTPLIPCCTSLTASRTHPIGLQAHMPSSPMVSPHTLPHC